MYHIMSRGNEGRTIFCCDDERFCFRSVMMLYAKRLPMVETAYFLKVCGPSVSSMAGKGEEVAKSMAMSRKGNKVAPSPSLPLLPFYQANG